MPNLNKCFGCQEMSCEGCPNMEPEMKLINPETEKPLTTEDVDNLLFQAETS